MSGTRLPRLRPRTRRRLIAGVLLLVAFAAFAVAALETSAFKAPVPSATAGGHRNTGTGTTGSGTGGSATGPSGTGANGDTKSGAKTAQSDGSASGPSAAGIPPIGVYVGPGNPGAAEAVSTQLEGRVPYALDFLPRTSWTALTNPTWLAQQWHGAPFNLVLGLPMLPENGGTLAQGASGAFDAQFRLLAQRLVQDNLANAILMVGYQPDDWGRPWYVATKAEAADYVRYWSNIRSAMAGVPGARFLFEWDAGDAGTSPLSPASMYPGNREVDIVATDAFDFVSGDPRTGGNWSTVLEQRYGPAWMAEFAAAHHKPMAIAMWGEVPRSAGGAGDRPGYVTGLLRWAASKRLVMSLLWDYQGMTLTGGGFPAADNALHQAVVPGAVAKRRDGA